jgi:hypothetical protein
MSHYYSEIPELLAMCDLVLLLAVPLARTSPVARVFLGRPGSTTGKADDEVQDRKANTC